MIRKSIAGGWYADCVLGGEWAALIRDRHLETSRGIVPLCPGGNVLFLRCRVVADVLYIAGQGNRDGAAWLWNGAQWVHVTAQTNGQKVVAFGPHGLYVASTPHTIDVFNLTGAHQQTLAMSPGSGGIQCVTADGEIVLGDATYGNGSDAPPGVAEWTQLGHLYIGGGYDGGVIINGHVLHPGDCFFIHAELEGEDIAVAFHTAQGAEFRWFTVGEIVTLPLASHPEPIPVPPQPTPEPQPMPDIESLTATVRRAVETINTAAPKLLRENTTESCGIFTEHVVNYLANSDPRFGHVGKSSGQTNYRRHAVDAVMYRDPKQVWDIIGGAENHPHAGSPQANPVDHGGQPWMAPIPIEVGGDTPPPPPPPVPVQPAVDLHVFLIVEYPKLVAEFMRKRPELGAPGHEWAAFQTWRRAVERWPYERVFAEV